MNRPSVRITVGLPAALLEATDALVRAGRVRSRSDLVTRAVEHELQNLEREAVDAQFALMAQDEEFQAEALRIASEFSGSDWEALREDEPGR